jgi:type II secretory ATPase GspE/PulE/Tfp pilus assembly ATPase PilB-like protein
MSLEEAIRGALALPEEEGPVSRAVDHLLGDAVSASVSDLHLNPVSDGIEVLYRMDGVLHRKLKLPAEWAERLIGRVKVLAGLLTYRRDIAQDGQIPTEKTGGRTDVRVSIFPTIYGEKAVLRFFLHGAEKFVLEELGLDAGIVRALRRAAGRPDGVVLLTGPSGSGKTTTIYALLRDLLRSSGSLKHVVTIEDPVEHVLEGITQTQVNAAAGVTFAYSLRALLRHDPQVIMVGEIRDVETARVAMQAGLTGHLVISTVHAGTAVGVVTRLRDIGIEPHVITAALSCVLAQRLVRNRCGGCSGRGCERCHGSGYIGRTVFAEMLLMDDRFRDAIASGRSRQELQRLAEEQGLVPLAVAGEGLVSRGVTTREELERVLG